MSAQEETTKALDMNNLPRALSPAQAAQVLGLSDDSWYRHIAPAMRRREFLWYKVGRKKRIITSSLLAWQEERAKREAAA